MHKNVEIIPLCPPPHMHSGHFLWRMRNCSAASKILHQVFNEKIILFCKKTSSRVKSYCSYSNDSFPELLIEDLKQNKKIGNFSQLSLMPKQNFFVKINFPFG